jgi:hypothetical protein
LFRKENSAERIAEIGLAKVPAPRARFSKKEDLVITSLREELGKKWGAIAERLNETFETEWSTDQVRARFNQMETERKQGGSKHRKVGWTANEDARFVALHDKWNKTHKTTYGMWKYFVANMPGKNEDDLRHRWKKISKSSDVTMTAMTSTATTLLTETSVNATLHNNQPNLFGVSLDGTSMAATKAAATKVATTKVATTKVAVKKVAAKKKVAPSSDSEQSDVYSSSDSEASDGYSSSEDKSDTVGGLSEYELRREQRIARNNARLAELGLGIVSKKAKTNVAKKRTLPPVNETRRVLPERKRNAKTYNEDYTEDVY